MAPHIDSHVGGIHARKDLRHRDARQEVLVAHPAALGDDFALDPGHQAAAKAEQADPEKHIVERAIGDGDIRLALPGRLCVFHWRLVHVCCSNSALG